MSADWSGLLVSLTPAAACGLGPHCAVKCSGWSKLGPDVHPAAPISSLGPCGPKAVLPAAPPLPTYRSIGAAQRRAGTLGAETGRGRAGVVAPCHSIARPPQRPESRGAAGHPHSVPGMWRVCVPRPRAGPPHRTQQRKVAGGLSGSAARPTSHHVASQQWASPKVWQHKSPGPVRGSTRVAVGWASHCCGIVVRRCRLGSRHCLFLRSQAGLHAGAWLTAVPAEPATSPAPPAPYQLGPLRARPRLHTAAMPLRSFRLHARGSHNPAPRRAALRIASVMLAPI